MYVCIYIYTHVATKQINTDTHTDIPRRRCFFALWPCRSCSCTADFPRCSFGCGSCRSTDCCHRFGCRVILSGSRQWVQSIPSIPASHEGPAPAEKMWHGRADLGRKVPYCWRCGMMWNKKKVVQTVGEEGWKTHILCDIHQQNKATFQFCNFWWLEKRHTRAEFKFCRNSLGYLHFWFEC